jgi:hypothetical protein
VPRLWRLAGGAMNRAVAGPQPEFSDAQILGGISAALRAGDMKAVVDLLHLLAVQSPREAQLIVDAIELLPGLEP